MVFSLTAWNIASTCLLLTAICERKFTFSYTLPSLNLLIKIVEVGQDQEWFKTLQNFSLQKLYFEVLGQTKSNSVEIVQKCQKLHKSVLFSLNEKFVISISKFVWNLTFSCIKRWKCYVFSLNFPDSKIFSDHFLHFPPSIQNCQIVKVCLIFYNLLWSMIFWEVLRCHCSGQSNTGQLYLGLFWYAPKVGTVCWNSLSL